MQFAIATERTTEELSKIAASPPPTQSIKPNEYAQGLMTEGLYPETVRILAAAMDPKTAIGWACTCARKLERPPGNPDKDAALKAAEKWLEDPSDENRRMAKELAEVAGLGTPEGAAAMAIFFSGGSLAPKGVQEVPPPPYACQKIAAGSILFTVLSQSPESVADRYGKAVELSGLYTA